MLEATGDMAKRALLTGLVVIVGVACGNGDTTDTFSGPGDEATTTSQVALPEETTTTAGESGGTPPIELAGSTWNITHHASELFSGVTNVWPDSELSLQFAADGAISGNAGCNDYNGTYQVDGPYVTEPDPFSDEEEGQSIDIEVTAVTAVACDDQNLMDQEAEYLDALGRADRWLIGAGFGGHNDLLLSSDDGLLVEGEPAG